MKNTKYVGDKEIDKVDNERVARPARQFSNGALIGIAAVVAVSAGAVGFVGGVQVQKGSDSSTVAGQSDRTGAVGGGMGRMNPNGSFGEVTAVSDASITISVMSGGPNSTGSNNTDTKTFTINSSTTFTINGSTGDASDINTGDTVMIEADSSNSSIAASIRAGMGGGVPQSTNQTQTN